MKKSFWWKMGFYRKFTYQKTKFFLKRMDRNLEVFDGGVCNGKKTQ
jgi:hypothetical protein